MTYPDSNIDQLNVPIRPSLTVQENGRVTIHQLVIREQDEEPPEEWIVTDIELDADEALIILSDPEFNFRLPVAEDVFCENGFIALVAEDGTPVWGY